MIHWLVLALAAAVLAAAFVWFAREELRSQNRAAADQERRSKRVDELEVLLGEVTSGLDQLGAADRVASLPIVDIIARELCSGASEADLDRAEIRIRRLAAKINGKAAESGQLPGQGVEEFFG